MSKLVFSEKGWDDYLYWQFSDKSILRKINELLKDVQRNGYEGLGKPEPLRYRKAWSRRINHEHRMIYFLAENNDIIILSLKGHYQD